MGITSLAAGKMGLSSRFRVREMNISSHKDIATKPAAELKSGAKLSSRVEKSRQH